MIARLNTAFGRRLSKIRPSAMRFKSSAYNSVSKNYLPLVVVIMCCLKLSLLFLNTKDIFSSGASKIKSHVQRAYRKAFTKLACSFLVKTLIKCDLLSASFKFNLEKEPRFFKLIGEKRETVMTVKLTQPDHSNMSRNWEKNKQTKYYLYWNYYMVFEPLNLTVVCTDCDNCNTSIANCTIQNSTIRNEKSWTFSISIYYIEIENNLNGNYFCSIVFPTAFSKANALFNLNCASIKQYFLSLGSKNSRSPSLKSNLSSVTSEKRFVEIRLNWLPGALNILLLT